MASGRLGRRLVLALSLLVLGYAGGSWWMAERLLTPDRRRPSPDPAALGHEFEPLHLTTADGLDLAAWIVSPAPPVRATVLVAHAKDGCRSAARQAWLAVRGFRSVAFDLRGHGESEGRTTTFGRDEALDVLAAKAVARERWPDSVLLGWGTSLGAAALLAAETSERGLVGRERVAMGDLSRACDGLILESLYADLETALANRVGLHLGAWAVPFFAAPRWLVERRTDLDARPVRPVEDIARLTEGTPLLLATGSLDRHATVEELERLAAAAPWAQTHVVPGVGHTDLLSGRADLWQRRLELFLSRW